MNNFGSKPDANPALPIILFESRELMTAHLKQVLPNVMAEVDDVLLDIAVRTTNSRERTKYFNAMHEVRSKRHNIEKRCIENFAELFSNNICSDNNETKDIEGVNDINMVAIENVANKVRKKCSQALRKLDESMNNLLRNAALETKKNPVSPEIVCMAFYNACQLIDSETEIRLIIFKYFEKNILPLLNDVYLEINSILEAGTSCMESQARVDRIKDYQSIADIRKTVTSEMQGLLTDKHVPDFVSDFLLNQWVKLLLRIYDKNGTNSDSWRHAKETAEDLIWSVGSLSFKQDKDRFDKLWVDLVMRLRNGMKIISMPTYQETDFISSLFKYRATLTMLAALIENRKNDATLIKPEKIKALKMKIKSVSGQVIASERDLDSTGSEDITMPVLYTYSGKQPHLNDELFNSHHEKMDLDNIGDEDITKPGHKVQTDSRPFMDELLVDNFKIKGFKTDITGG